MAGRAEAALADVERALPRKFPEAIHASVKAAVSRRLRALLPA
jgi:hypothetical protein